MMQKIDKTDTLKKILSGNRFTVDYYQREYRWGRKQIEQMLNDFSDTFREFYDPDNHSSVSEVKNYGYYYMGSIICTSGANRQIIDGQQRLTSLTLLLIYLNDLQKTLSNINGLPVSFMDMVYTIDYGTPCFNIDVEERSECLKALLDGDVTYTAKTESNQNMVDRYHDICELFPDDLKTEALPYFIYWLIQKVLLLEIDTPSEDEAHTVFLTMNDRGLSLNSAEMMKAYIIQQVEECDRKAVNAAWQANINRIKRAAGDNSSGIVNTEEVDFISVWLRAKYAWSLRENKKGAEDRDFELLGDKFHTWVRQNAKSVMGMAKPQDFRTFVIVEMTKVTDLYLRLKKYSEALIADYQAVFYNANRDLNYQTMMILAAVKNDDAPAVVDKKIQMVSGFVDDFASIRIFNFKKVNWNTNKSLLFRVMCNIRNQQIKTVGINLIKALERMDEKIEGITAFELNQFTGRYMLHILGRFTSFVNTNMGYPSQFDIYVDRKGSTPYDIEHILPDDYESYKSDFNDEEDFANWRQKFGNLIILTRDKNRSYQKMSYKEKVVRYMGDNVLAQALNQATYKNNPQFLKVAKKYGLAAIDQFNKDSIKNRMDVYLNMARNIWNPDNIKVLAGGWDEDDEVLTVKSGDEKKFTVGYADRSWADAVKYGFLSANQGGSGKTIGNIKVGDMVFCYIAGKGFVGIGICMSTAVPMNQFMVEDNGKQTSILQVQWIDGAAKAACDIHQEWFIGVKWLKYVESEEDGYYEKGLTSVPLVAYELTDNTTHNKVLDHFHVQIK